MFKYGMIVWEREWISDDGTEEEWSIENTQWFESKKEMRRYIQWAKSPHMEDGYRYEFFKVKKWKELT